MDEKPFHATCPYVIHLITPEARAHCEAIWRSNTEYENGLRMNVITPHHLTFDAQVSSSFDISEGVSWRTV
jgi:hypothetical protein